MIHLIPHPTQQLNIINFQKLLIRRLQNERIIFFQTIPLWILLPDTFSDLKKTASSITKINILLPEVNSETMEIYSPVEISCDGKIILSKMILLESITTNKTSISKDLFNQTKIELKKICTENKNFPCILNIFKAANTQQVSDNSKSVEKFVWKKLKN
ncbi:MAG: hypothetical protein MJ174_00205 [Treponema sp.]|nr:hypothetical protein [Treponema sp.]